jgi:hypothetical protein
MNSAEKQAIVLIAEVERYLRAEAWRAELETADYGDDPVTEEMPVRATFADGTEARHLNVGRLGLCGPDAMRRAIEREEER